MIVCTRCATPNEEQARYCIICGHKLQSGRAGREEAVSRTEELRPLDHGDGVWFRRLLGRCLEVWMAIAVLGGAVAYGLAARNWWPALVCGGLAAVFLLFRRE